MNDTKPFSKVKNNKMEKVYAKTIFFIPSYKTAINIVNYIKLFKKTLRTKQGKQIHIEVYLHKKLKYVNGALHATPS